MTTVNLFAAIGGAFAVLLVVGFLQSAPDPSAELTRTYLRLMRLSPSEGRLHLAERLEALSLRFPGHPQAWYLRWLVNDLQRAKR